MATTDTTDNKNHAQNLWERLNHLYFNAPEIRQQKFGTIIRHLREQSEGLSISDLMQLQYLVGHYTNPVILPRTLSVAQFFFHLISSRHSATILDPAAGFGLVGAWLGNALPESRVDLISSYPDLEEVINPLNLESVSAYTGSLENMANKLVAQYDAIVSLPPIGHGSERRTFQLGDLKVDLSDAPSLLLIAEAAQYLSPTGFFAFGVAHRFAWDIKPNSLRRNLERFGLHLTALLSFRPGTFTDVSGVALAIIERTPQSGLFVAEVPEDSEAQKELVARLWKRKQGVTPSQGRIVPENEFHGLSTLEAKERAAKLAKGKGLEPVSFDLAVKEIRVPERNGAEFEPCIDDPNAVYLPEMATTAATTRQEDLPERLKSYLQLIVDPAIVLPTYLADLLNTPLGHALRQAVMTGMTIPRINRSLLRKSTLYLAPIADQRRACDAVALIHQLRNELSELEAAVWERPRRVDAVIEKLGKVNHEERFDEWVETLPFPLASILRSYHAIDRTDKEKYERLLYFFEAFTLFCAAIHLSAFKSSSNHWQVQRERIVNQMRSQHSSFERATFGLWRSITESLAGTLRSMLNSKDDRPVVLSLYATAESLPLEMLSSKDLLGLLQRVNNFRNRWSGHGGAVTPQEAFERHELLKQDIEKLREVVGSRFLQYELIEPREAEILPGSVIKCRVRRVMGSNPQLEHHSVTITTLAIKGMLYFHNPGYDKVLQLLPLVQLHDKPQPASYFYNRLEQSALHLVSYHFAATSEVSSPSVALAELFNDFNLNDTASEEVES